MRIALFFLSIVCVSLILDSCKPFKKINNVDDIHSYISNEDNGLLIEKMVNNLTVRIQYLPNEYLSLKESKIMDSSYDSLLKLYKNSYSFLMTIEPNEKSNVASIKEWNEPSTMNFIFPAQISMIIDNSTYKPVLFNAEETYNLKEKRVFNIVFAQASKEDSVFSNAKELTIKLMDEYFGLGTMYFEFNKKDINEFSSLVIK